MLSCTCSLLFHCTKIGKECLYSKCLKKGIFISFCHVIFVFETSIVAFRWNTQKLYWFVCLHNVNANEENNSLMQNLFVCIWYNVSSTKGSTSCWKVQDSQFEGSLGWKTFEVSPHGKHQSLQARWRRLKFKMRIDFRLGLGKKNQLPQFSSHYKEKYNFQFKRSIDSCCFMYIYFHQFCVSGSQCLAS